MIALRIRTFAKFFICILIGAVFSSVVAFAWTGPTQTAPNGNVSAPVNVGTTDQTKNAGLGVNSLAVFGNAILSGAARYFNFGSTVGSGGYGIRDNAGTMEFKNSGGSWNSLVGTIQSFFSAGNSVSQVKFADGTTQTTAAAGGGITALTTASCTLTWPSIGQPSTCTVACPAGFYRTGCSFINPNGNSGGHGAQPSGSNGCYCISTEYTSQTCYAYCAK